MTERNNEVKKRAIELVGDVVVKLFEKALVEKDFNKFANDTNLADIGLNLKKIGKFSYNDAFQRFENIINKEIELNPKVKDGSIKIDKVRDNELGDLQCNIIDKLDNYLNGIIEHCKNDNEKALNIFKIECFAKKLIDSLPTEKNPIGFNINMLDKYNMQFNNLLEQLGETKFREKEANMLAGLDNLKVNSMDINDIVSTLEVSHMNLKTLGGEEEKLNSEITIDSKEGNDTTEKEEDIKKIRSKMGAEKEKIDIFKSQLSFISRNIENTARLMFTDVIEEKNLNLESLEKKQYGKELLVNETLRDLYPMMQKWLEVSKKIKNLEGIDKDFKTELEQSCNKWNEIIVENGAAKIMEKYFEEPKDEKKIIETVAKVSSVLDSLSSKLGVEEISSNYINIFLNPNVVKFCGEYRNEINNKKTELLGKAKSGIKAILSRGKMGAIQKEQGRKTERQQNSLTPGGSC